MGGNQKDTLNNTVKGLLFDLSSDEKTARVRAIRGLIQFATLEPVKQAVREIFESEQDPHCKQGLKEILDIYEQNSEKGKIRLVRGQTSFAALSSLDPEKLNNEKQPLPKTAAVPIKKINLTSGHENKIRSMPTKEQPTVNQRQSDASGDTIETVQAEDKTEKPTNPSFNQRLEGLKKISNSVLEWAAQNNLRVTGAGLGIIMAVLLCFAAFVVYNVSSGSQISYSGKSGKLVEKVAALGEIQTGDVPTGEVIKGTLKEYNQFAQIWFFLADDGRLYKLKLNKAPGFYKVEEKLDVLVEGCQKNSLGHTVLMGNAEKQ